jgi:hypothetical protein
MFLRVMQRCQRPRRSRWWWLQESFQNEGEASPGPILRSLKTGPRPSRVWLRRPAEGACGGRDKFPASGLRKTPTSRFDSNRFVPTSGTSMSHLRHAGPTLGLVKAIALIFQARATSIYAPGHGRLVRRTQVFDDRIEALPVVYNCQDICWRAFGAFFAQLALKRGAEWISTRRNISSRAP